MASTAPSAAYGPYFHGYAWAIACATRSTSSRQADRRLDLGAQGFALEVSRPVALMSTAQKPTGGTGQHLRHFADRITATVRSAWRARSPVVPGQESRLVYGARRPADAGDEHRARSSAQRPRPQTLRDERLPPSRWESSGVSHWPGTPVQLDPLSVPGPERGPVWGGSGRRSRPTSD